MKEKERNKKSYFHVAGLGIDLVVSTLVGGFIGYLIDRNFGTEPVFLIVFVFLGALSGFLNIYRAVKKMDSEQKG
ncbi:MAG: AtpZ/AtpI family protein [Archaeoglobaceae archaeon]